MILSNNIKDTWYEGDLECSFHADLYLKLEVKGLSLSHIRPHGRKVITGTKPFLGDPFSLEKNGFLEENYLTEIEVYPFESAGYPLDIPRKFNAVEVVILNPEISEIREAKDKRIGKLKGKIYFKIKRIHESKAIIEEKKKLFHEKIVLQRKAQIHSRSTLSKFHSFRFNGWRRVVHFFSFIVASINFLQFILGGLLALFLIFGIVGLVTKGCGDNRISVSERHEELNHLESWKVNRNLPIEQSKFHIPEIEWDAKDKKFADTAMKNLSILGTYLLDHPSIHFKMHYFGNDVNNQSITLEEIETFFLKIGIEKSRYQLGEIYNSFPRELKSNTLIVQFINTTD